MQASPKCSSCGVKSSTVGSCPHCGVANFCQQCIGSDAEQYRKHVQNIKFSITAPSHRPGFRNFVERAASDYAADGLGAVHQWLLCEAVTKDVGGSGRQSLREFMSVHDTECLTAGIVYNDFPVVDERNCDGYMKLLERIDAADVQYISDAAFRLQPKQSVRFALALDYKHLPRLLNPLFGVDDEACQVAADMLELRTRDSRTHYHFMKENSTETVGSVIRRAMATTEKWYRDALAGPAVNYFLIGHITHTWTDSYSAGHTNRGKATAIRDTRWEFSDPEAAAAALKDTSIIDIYFFGDQTDQSHGELESWRAVSRPGSEPRRRALAAIVAVRELLRLVQVHHAALNSRPPSLTLDEAVQRFVWLSRDIFG